MRFMNTGSDEPKARTVQAMNGHGEYKVPGGKLVVADDKAGALRLGGRFLTGDPDSFLDALRTTFGLRTVDDGPSRILLKSR
jgi:ferric-dicitrate binding protein FerR (iron transport regulator)